MIDRLRRVLLREKPEPNPFRHIKGAIIGADFSIGKYKNIIVSASSLITIAEKVTLREFCSFLVYEKGNLVIGKNVFFNNYCSINCLENIEVGDNTLFGEGVKIYDHNHIHQFEDNILKVERSEFKTAPVIIGSNCWIGSNVTILKGVHIGDNVIIGANNLVYKSIPSNTIIKSNQSYSVL